MTTLEEMTARLLSRDPHQPAIEYQHGWTTWWQLRHIAERVNALIDACGADPLSPCAFVPRNRPEALAALLGLIARGRWIRMVHAYQSPAGIARDIELLEPACVVAMADDFGGEVIAAIRQRGICTIALSGMDAATVSGCELSTAACAPPPPVRQIDLLTSGTTGHPKQFPLTYELIANDMVAMNVINRDDDDPAEAPPAYLYYPFANFSGLYSTLAPILRGLRGYLVDRFNLENCHDYLVRYRPAWLGLPPAGIQMILDADWPAEYFESLEEVRTGAGPVPLTAHREFEERYGKPLLLAYGATEFAGPVSMMTRELHKEWGAEKRGSVGKPLPGVCMRVRDPETDEILPSGEEGVLEIIVPRIGADWLRTSDLVMIDKDGFVFHRGRADGAINRGGFKLLPETIEQALASHEAVAAAAVVGIPDKRLGQVPAAAIELKNDAGKPPVEALEAHLRQHLAATHIPTVWRFVPSLPVTSMMKIDRRAVKQLFAAETAQAAEEQTGPSV